MWAVCEKFSDYLYGSLFSVLTENNPLAYVLTSAKLDTAAHRWLASLSTYHFTIKYRAGQVNKDANGLSRRPQEPPYEDEEFVIERARINDMKKCLIETHNELDHELSPPSVSAILCQPHQSPFLLWSLSLLTLQLSLRHMGKILPSMNDADWCTAQRANPSIARVTTLLEGGVKPGFKETNLSTLMLNSC